MEHGSARRIFWHASAGFGVGLACTIATALFATGEGCSARQLSGTLLVCSPLLSTLPALLTSSRRLGPIKASALTGVLAIAMGAVNATVVWVVTQMLSGGNLHDLGAVLIFSLPFGGVPGAGYAVPLAFGTWFARKKLDAPPDAIGAGRGLLLTVAVVGAAASGLVVTQGPEPYPFWTVLLAFDVVVAAACGWVAIRDVVWVLRLRRMQRDSTGSFELVGSDPTSPTPGLRHIVGSSFGLPEPTHVMRVQPQDTAPYRSSRARVPVLSIEASPTNVRRSLLATASVLAACAALLVYCATQMPSRAPEHPVECIARPPSPQIEY